MVLQGRLLCDPREVPRQGWVRIADGRIESLGEGEPPEPPAAGGADRLISPGFVDAHVHLPQMAIVGCDGLELLDWLREVVFPAELRWADASVAGAEALEAHRRMLACGTLGYAGFLTSHATSVVAALRAGHRLPLRAIAGQVLMDRHAHEALLTGEIARPEARSKRGRMALSVNPRFAVACSEELLAAAGARATGDVFIQTHLAESKLECARVAELFPGDPHYAGLYDRHGLLGPRTLLAHCIHLASDEWELLAARKSVAVHCPTANLFLSAGLFDLDAARRHGVRVALGSDVAAGPDLAMPRVARAMIEVAKMRAMASSDPARVHVPSPADAWDQITRVNADALGFGDGGRLEPGAVADLLVLRTPFPADRHLIGRLIYTWRDDYIERIVLNGQLL